MDDIHDFHSISCVWRFKTLGSWFCIRSHGTCSSFAEYPLLCLMGFRLRCCLPAFVCDWDSSIPNCILLHLRIQYNFSSSVLRHVWLFCFVPVFDGDHLNMTSPPVLLQKVLSDLQADNQQRLKDREQELKNLKKVMEVAKVSRQSFILQKLKIVTNPCTMIVSFPAQRSAIKVHSDTEQTLMELQRSVERLQELMEEVLDQANLEKMSQAQEVADSLEAEIKVLKKRDSDMKDLAQCEDHIHYLQVGQIK